MKCKSVLALLLFSYSATAQVTTVPPASLPLSVQEIALTPPFTWKEPKIKLQPVKWRITGNHYLTGGLAFVAGASKGFNETLQFHWKEFRRQFPKANPQWFNPSISWRNKYRNGDPEAGSWAGV